MKNKNNSIETGESAYNYNQQNYVAGKTVKENRHPASEKHAISEEVDVYDY
jgi:hypothetical protein